MASTSLVFGSDQIQNLPAWTSVVSPGHTSTYAGDTSIANSGDVYIYNYGGNEASISASASAISSSVTATFSLSSVAGFSNAETLVVGGSTLVVGGIASFVGTAASITALLDNAYVVDTKKADKFEITVKMTEGGNAPRTTTGIYTVACFVTGTRIGTPDGERAVEKLAVGDVVNTAKGERRVAWIGTRTYEADMLRAEPWLRPVEIRRGALGRGLPRRDLRVSPEHAMLIDGALVRAAALVNGRTIFHAPITGDVTYFHVELENEHGILFAEGAATESFRDEGSRVLFDNAAEYTLAQGTTAAVPPLAAPRVDEGYELEAIRHRLAGGMDEAPAGSVRGHVERLVDGVLEGWVMDAANPLVPVEIEVRVSGKPVGRTIANGYRTDLHGAGIGVGRAGFRFVLPTGCDDLGAVSVVRAFDGAALPIAETATV